MTQKQQALISELINLLPQEQKGVFQKIVDYFVELGYIPQKQNVHDFILSFKHKENGKVISKMGVRGKAFIAIRFFACKSVPQKYMDALRHEFVPCDGQYSSRQKVNPVNTITNRCNYCGDICSGGGLGYYYKFADGQEVARCGAYPIVIPDIVDADIEEMKKVILEQHNYFLSIA